MNEVGLLALMTSTDSVLPRKTLNATHPDLVFFDSSQTMTNDPTFPKQAVHVDLASETGLLHCFVIRAIAPQPTLPETRIAGAGCCKGADGCTKFDVETGCLQTQRLCGKGFVASNVLVFRRLTAPRTENSPIESQV